jgi:hypothetical protein
MASTLAYSTTTLAPHELMLIAAVKKRHKEEGWITCYCGTVIQGVPLAHDECWNLY